VNVVQSRNGRVLLDTRVFHWLSMCCSAIDDVPVATRCLLKSQSMQNEGLK